MSDAAPQTKTCPKCGKAVDARKRLCHHCGAAFPLAAATPTLAPVAPVGFCPRCEMAVRQRVCPACGAQALFPAVAPGGKRSSSRTGWQIAGVVFGVLGIFAVCGLVVVLLFIALVHGVEGFFSGMAQNCRNL